MAIKYGEIILPGAMPGRPPQERTCPPWLELKLRDYKLLMGGFSNPPAIYVPFEKTVFWRSARRWAGMYTTSVFNVSNPRDQWVEKFIVVYVNNRMTVIEQQGQRFGWRTHLNQ